MADMRTILPATGNVPGAQYPVEQGNGSILDALWSTAGNIFNSSLEAFGDALPGAIQRSIDDLFADDDRDLPRPVTRTIPQWVETPAPILLLGGGLIMLYLLLRK